MLSTGRRARESTGPIGRARESFPRRARAALTAAQLRHRTARGGTPADDDIWPGCAVHTIAGTEAARRAGQAGRVQGRRVRRAVRAYGHMGIGAQGRVARRAGTGLACCAAYCPRQGAGGRRTEGQKGNRREPGGRGATWLPRPRPALCFRGRDCRDDQRVGCGGGGRVVRGGLRGVVRALCAQRGISVGGRVSLYVRGMSK